MVPTFTCGFDRSNVAIRKCLNINSEYVRKIDARELVYLYHLLVLPTLLIPAHRLVKEPKIVRGHHTNVSKIFRQIRPSTFSSSQDNSQDKKTQPRLCVLFISLICYYGFTIPLKQMFGELNDLVTVVPFIASTVI